MHVWACLCVPYETLGETRILLTFAKGGGYWGDCQQNTLQNNVMYTHYRIICFCY